ncbi:EF-hand domain-containing protein [Phaeovulum sp. W22_SRMD_FR3]|uniref:EF-hand domain-containing protein n=1 Tax=Phaeovulum sp. W22_SRMD_FR3 TaxID=3240274 RepID=UPI003F9DB9B6
MKTILLSTALMSLLGLGAAVAQTGAPGAQFVTQWDADGDGQVTLAEATARRGDIFVMFDADDNGTFSADELAAIDAHHAAEAENGHGPMAGMPDGMRAGRPGDMTAGHGPMDGMGKGFGKGRGEGQGPQGNPGGTQGAGAMLAGLDSDRDRLISKTEFVAGTADWFARMDRNSDGVITAADFGPGR